MIEPIIYKKILDNFVNKEENCKNNNISICFLYTRLIKEGKISYRSKDYLNNIEKI